MNALTFRRMVFAVVILLSNVAGDAWGQQYTVTDLGTLPGGTFTCATGINNTGQVVGYANTGGNDAFAFLYSGGSMQRLAETSSEAFGINDNGEVVGYFSDGSHAHSFLYGNGRMQDLDAFVSGPSSIAYGINNHRQVVGVNSGGGFFYGDPASTNGTTTYLPSAFGINDSGQVVGTISGDGDAFLYSNGVLRDLGTLPGGTSSQGNGINNSGQVVGQAYVSYGFHAFIWQIGAGMQDLGTLGGDNSRANAINNLGQIVGEADTTSGVRDPFVYSDGSMQDLNFLIASNPGWTLTNPTDINDNGQIVCQGTNASGETHTFLLSPVPEPSTLASLAAGALAVVGYIWRRQRAMHHS
jgi:probable HAF family extracellular repeat protein